MQVIFKLYKKIITHYNSENKPVYGDLLRIIVDGQIFNHINTLGTINEVDDLKKVEIDETHRLELFGEALKDIGAEIVRQANHGVGGTIVRDGRKITFFKGRGDRK